MSHVVTQSRRRGQPVVVLAAIAVGWIALRAATWPLPFAQGPAPATAAAPRTGGAPASAIRSDRPAVSSETGLAQVVVRQAGQRSRDPATVPSGPLHDVREPQRATSVAPRHAEAVPAPWSMPQARLAEPPLPPPVQSNGPPFDPVAGRSRRWHVDAWYAWRPGSGLPRVAAGGPLPPAYGGTQGGVLLRYDLGRSDRHPQLYLRATHAPSRPQQADVAAGIGLRPFAQVPVRVQGEARLTSTEGWTEVRPAAAAITELAPAALPLGFRGEAYAQAGYVGGREATGFVDGQARIDREVASLGKAGLRLGGGVWGGAQKYASRLDVGPSVTLDLRDAGVPLRAALDYRLRVTGTARPADGPTLTISTGF